MKGLFTAKTITTQTEESKNVIGYYVYSNQDKKHLIIARDSTPIDTKNDVTWQKVYEIDFDTLETYNEN